MPWRAAIVALASLLAAASNADAHPAPFTYLDLRLERNAIEGTVLAHDFDVAHDLGGADPNAVAPERLQDPGFVAANANAIIAILAPRLTAIADGARLAGVWSGVEAVPDRQAVRLHVRFALPAPAGVVSLSMLLFPYDPVHQTFLNIYEGDALTQAIFDRGRTDLTYYAASRQGTTALLTRFAPAGFRHIALGADHLVFLLGLLLLGGSPARLALIVTAFTAANLATLALGVFNVVAPPVRYIEPAIALSIVYVGADNLLVNANSGSRDMRVWIAAAFGAIHGFGFAQTMRAMDLPRHALVWSLVSFNAGVEAAQLALVCAAGLAIAAVRARSASAGRLIAVGGSVVVIAAGAVWFVQRVFFPS